MARCSKTKTNKALALACGALPKFIDYSQSASQIISHAVTAFTAFTRRLNEVLPLFFVVFFLLYSRTANTPSIPHLALMSPLKLADQTQGPTARQLSDVGVVVIVIAGPRVGIIIV